MQAAGLICFIWTPQRPAIISTWLSSDTRGSSNFSPTSLLGATGARLASSSVTAEPPGAPDAVASLASPPEAAGASGVSVAAGSVGVGAPAVDSTAGFASLPSVVVPSWDWARAGAAVSARKAMPARATRVVLIM